MPTVLRADGLRSFFYSNEGVEPAHVHVEAAESREKYWLTPIELVWNDGFRSGEQKTIENILSANIDLFLEEWNAHFAAE